MVSLSHLSGVRSDLEEVPVPSRRLLAIQFEEFNLYNMKKPAQPTMDDIKFTSLIEEKLRRKRVNLLSSTEEKAG